MKILFFHTDFKLYWKDRLKYLSRFLENYDHQLFIVEIFDSAGNYNFDKVIGGYNSNWINLGLNEKSKIKDIKKKSFEAINKIKPDIIFAGSIAFYSGAIGQKYCLKNNIDIVHFDDMRYEDLNSNFIKEFIKKKLYQNAKGMFIPSASHKQLYLDYGFKDKNIFYGVDVVDNEYYYKNSEMSKNPVRKNILFIGRLIEKKNVEYLIKEFGFFVEDHPDDDFVLKIIGDGEQCTYLKKLSAKKIKDHRVSFLGFQDKDAIKDYLHEADFLCLPSNKDETWGLVVNEAMASSTAVLVSVWCGCAKTLVRDGYNGFTFDPNKKGKLANILKNISNMEKNEIDEMGKNSKKLIQHWGLETFSKSVLTLIELPSISRNFISSVLIKFWSGRYNSI